MSLSEIPNNYSLCLNRQCPQAATCLRQLAEQEMGDDVERWIIISPKRLAALKGDCPYYRSNVKVYFAKGFINILGNIPSKSVQSVADNLIGHFGRATYYRVRKGERLLSPAEQKAILDIIKRYGVAQPQEFDAYIEDYDW